MCFMILFLYVFLPLIFHVYFLLSFSYKLFHALYFSSNFKLNKQLQNKQIHSIYSILNKLIRHSQIMYNETEKEKVVSIKYHE
jgi:hypothetical protein